MSKSIKIEFYGNGGGGVQPSSDAIQVGIILDTTTAFPELRPDGTDLHNEDWVVYSGAATKEHPKTIGGVSFTESGQKAYYDIFTNSWVLSAGIIVNSDESITGDKNMTDDALKYIISSINTEGDKYMDFLKNKIVRLVACVLLVASTVVLLLGGVSKEQISDVISAIVGALSAIVLVVSLIKEIIDAKQKKALDRIYGKNAK